MPDTLKKLMPARRTDAHKGECGRILVVAGATGYTGAAYLCAEAAARSGSGLVTLAIGKSAYPILAAKLTEVMVRPLVETKDGSPGILAEKELCALAEKSDCLAVGPGISQNKETQSLVREFIAKTAKPVVLDADGINAFGGHVASLKKVKARLVMTPHPGEFARLTGKTVDDIQARRKELALSFANEYNTVLVLKGHHTVVAGPDGGIYINKTGNAGMASGGCGDVLTGMIASFIGQGLVPFDAAALGVYCHGVAGDLAEGEVGALSLLATDLLRKVPAALKSLA